MARKVKEAAAKAQKLQEDLIKRKEAEAVPPAEPDATPPAGQDAPGAAPEGTPPEAANQDMPPAAPAAPEAGAPGEEFVLPPVTPEEGYEQKYRVLQGKYNKEVPLLHRQMAELTGQIQSLERIIATMGDKGSPEASPAADGADDKLINTLKEHYPDIHDAVSRMTDRKVKEALSKIQPQIGKIETEVRTRTETDFYAGLDAAFPGWEKVNTHPVFVSWLQQMDELSGKTRQVLILDAFHAKDVKRTAKFFRAFLADNPTFGKPAASPQAAAAARARSGGDVDVHPVSTGSTPPPQPRQRDANFIKRSEIAKFYQDVAAGKYRDDAEGKKKREKEIEKAVAEGRVR